MLEFQSNMDKDAGEACFYYSFNCYGIFLCGNNKLWCNFIWAFIYLLFVDNTGLFTIGPWYCFRAKTEKRTGQKTGAKGPWQVRNVHGLSSIFDLKVIGLVGNYIVFSFVIL